MWLGFYFIMVVSEKGGRVILYLGFGIFSLFLFFIDLEVR